MFKQEKIKNFVKKFYMKLKNEKNTNNDQKFYYLILNIKKI